MENKVQEIAEKIYNEGVEKGQIEAKQIIEAAEVTKAEMLKKAELEADRIVAEAKKAADELSNNTQSELKLYANRAVEALKSEITNLITGTVVDASVRETVDKQWLQKLMLALATGWTTSENVVIQTSDAEALTNYFAKEAKNLLDKGVKIEQVNGKATKFAIMPANKSYKIEFGEAEFAAYFQEILRPQLIEMLFKQ